MRAVEVILVAKHLGEAGGMANGTAAFTVDFLDAHERHWSDAEFLFQDERWGNADHLYGMCAECGLKAIMVALGVATDAEGSPERPHREHINILWPLFRSFLSGRQAAHLAMHLPQSNPFSKWRVFHRYANGTYFSEGETDVHRKGARDVRHLVERARQEGFLQ